MTEEEFYFVNGEIMGRQALLRAFAEGSVDMRGWRILNCPDIKGSFDVKAKAGGSNLMRIERCRGLINVVGRLDEMQDRIEPVIDIGATVRAVLEEMSLGGQRQICLDNWHSGGLTWEHPEAPPQNHNLAQEGDPDFPCPITGSEEAGWRWFPNSDNCQCVQNYYNLGWDYAHTVIPWHAVNPFYDPTSDVSDASYSPRQAANLARYLGWLQEFSFETLIVRSGAQGDALHELWARPSNNFFTYTDGVFSGIDLSTTERLPPVNGFKTLGVDDNGILLSVIGANRQTGEPPKGLSETVWYRVTGDDRQWVFALSKPEKFRVEVFYANDPLNPKVNDLSATGDLNDGGATLVFQAASTQPYYYVRVALRNYGAATNSPSYPDYYALNYGRGTVPGGMPTPIYPPDSGVPSGWRERQVVENSAFIRNVARLVEANKGRLNVIYDVGGEHGNQRLIYDRLHRYYCERLWSEWVADLGTDNTCAFSGVGGTGVGNMIDFLNEKGLPLPPTYAFDSYGYISTPNNPNPATMYDSLKALWEILVANGEEGKFVHVFETYYNDAVVAGDIKKALNETGLRFGGITQWARVRGAPRGGVDPYFADEFPKAFNNYILI